MKNFLLLTVMTVFFSSGGYAAELGDCSEAWRPYLNTNPLESKYLSGDTAAAYGVYMFQMNRRNEVDLILEGRDYAARFWSLQTYVGRTQRKTDHRFDRDFAIGADGRFRVQVTSRPEGPQDLALARTRLWRPRVYSIMLRVYKPEARLASRDLPRIIAVDPRTGERTECPRVFHPERLDISQRFLNAREIRRRRSVDFKPQPFWFDLLGLGGNSAVPEYRQATHRVDESDDVVVIRFKAPTYGKDPEAQTRYWSLCFQDFAHNTTLACLPDYRSRVDEEGFVTAVFARPHPAVVSQADQLGYNYIEDSRALGEEARDLQNVVGFAYRNLLPSESFHGRAYQGPFAPRGRLCKREEFLDPEIRRSQCLPEAGE